MELYTVVERNENAKKALGGIYILKKEYSNKEVNKFLEIAKHYYIHIHTETDSTDFNDRYSDSWDNYITCNYLNLVIKEDELFGFIAYGLGKYDEDVVILTFDKTELTLLDGSCYSSIDRTFKLKKYDLCEEVLDLVQTLRVTRKYKCYKLVDEKEVFDSEGSDTYFLNGFDFVVLDGKAKEVKCCGRSFELANLDTYKQEYVVENTHGVVKYRYYYQTVLHKI